MPYFKLGKNEIHYISRGNGPLIVFLHAIGLDALWWEPFLKHFESDFCVVAIDLRGHGQSSVARQPISLQDHASDVAGVIESLGSDAHVVGVSMGGMVAQYLAIQYPEKVLSLVLFSTMATLSKEARQAVAHRGEPALEHGMSAVVHDTVERWVGKADHSLPFAIRCATQLMRQEPTSWAANWRAISQVNSIGELSNLKCPISVCTGSDDVSTPPAVASQIVSALASSPSPVSVQIIADAGHLGVFETPDTFIPVLSKHLERVSVRYMTDRISIK